MSAGDHTIETRIPARLDRLPWSRFHWLVVIGLGTAWILDGLEVTMVSSVASRLTEKGSGIPISVSQIGVAAAMYVAGACIGALVFGQMTDRFGRKRLFIITLAVYIVATVATAFSFAVWYFYLVRFLTGAGIGGEYAAINSAIDELIPARVRGRVDLIINGSYWVGAMAGSAAALIFLSSTFALNVGWRLSFGVGAVLGLAVMLVRRNVPESPRWLFIHGREEEAEQIVDRIERDVAENTGQKLEEPGKDEAIEVHQRASIPFTEIARTAFGRYPKRAVLGLALFIGQAFIYNGITFNLGTLFSTFFGVSAAVVPVFLIIWAAANFLGPLALGRLFDTIGRKPMIAFTYIGSAVAGAVLAATFASGSLSSEWWFEALIVVTFFLASAGASAAYLTVSEIFPMETRAMAIAFFYAIGTAAGGIAGPLLFANLISSGSRSQVAIAFYIGAAAMAVGGLAEIVLGVPAEQRPLEEIATPLTAEEAGAEGATEDREDEPHGEEGAERPVAMGEWDAARRRRRIQQRTEQRRSRDRTGMRRFRPGPGAGLYAPRMAGLYDAADTGDDLDREIELIGSVVDQRGALDRRELARAAGASYWGPGRFREALREAVREGRVRRLSRNSFGPARRA